MLTTIATAGDSKDEAIQKDRKQIEGTWSVVTLVVDGNSAKEEDARKLAVINGADGTWRLRSEGAQISEGTSTIDPSKKPKTIDFTLKEGDGNGKQHFGIYESGEDTRKLCFGPPGTERPTEFSSKLGSKHILVTFERDKAR